MTIQSKSESESENLSIVTKKKKQKQFPSHNRVRQIPVQGQQKETGVTSKDLF